MMMQMLAAGGMPVLTDGQRQADTHNPNGYFEFSPVKQIARDTDWLADAPGRAVKVVAPLLEWLPPGYAYRIVLMQRSVEEVEASQQRMLGQAQAEDLRAALAKAQERARVWVQRQKNVACIEVAHSETVARPRDVAERIATFLRRSLDVHAMAAAVDARLHRQKRLGI